MQTNFSSEEQIQKSKDFLNQLEKPSCNGCARGVSMCYTMPCMGTVEDIEKIMDAGFSKNLMLDGWASTETKDKAAEKVAGKPIKMNLNENPFNENISYLVPAIVGLEGKKAPFTRHGQCNLLVDNLCSLHEKGIKPVQGKTACCSIDNMYFDHNGRQKDIDTRIPILTTWNTQKGVDLIERWKKEVGFEGNDEFSGLPTSVHDILSSMVELFEVQSGIALKKTNCPPIDTSNPPEVKVVMYERPY